MTEVFSREAARTPLDLRAAAEAMLAEMECPHRDTHYGNCFDCYNSGYNINCQQEDDLVTACLLILKTTYELTIEDAKQAFSDLAEETESRLVHLAEL